VSGDGQDEWATLDGLLGTLDQTDASDMRSLYEALGLQVTTRLDQLKLPLAPLYVALALVSEDGHAP
jgi:hypothetical protein